MKKFYSILAGLLLALSSLAQAPKKLSYQAVIRNSSNALVTNTVVGMKISILQGNISGTPVYAETQKPTTNANGLVTLAIGSGTVVTGIFSAINWETGPYFIKTEADPMGGSAYTIIGTSELLSVPYALYSDCVPVSVSGTGDTLNIGCHSVIIPGISAANVVLPSPVYCASGPTAIVPVTNPATGKIWMDRNLGASQAATSSTDAAAYGDLYQWGRRTDGHQCRTSSTTNTLSSISQPVNGNFILAPSIPHDWRSPQFTNLWQGVNGVNNPCPITYRLPTEAELDAERASWSIQTSVGAFSSPLKLPVAGFRLYSSGSLGAVGADGNYWSSTIMGGDTRYLAFGSTAAFIFTYYRAYGFSVRCIKN